VITQWDIIATRAVLAMRSRVAGALPPEEHEKHLAAQRDNSDQDGAPKGEALR